MGEVDLTQDSALFPNMILQSAKTLYATALIASTCFSQLQAQTNLEAQPDAATQITPEMGLFSANPDMNGKPVSAVDIRVTSNKTIDMARLRNLVKLKSGGKYDTDVVNNDTKSLYDSGLVSNVTVRTIPSGGDSYSVVYEVDTQPILAGVGFRGNGNFNEKKLREQTKLVVGKAVSDKDLRIAINELRKFYSDEDYPNVQIGTSFQKSARNGYVDLYFDINEGGEQMVRNINFPGNTAFDEKKLKNEIRTKEKGIFSFLTSSGKIDNMMLDEDEQKLVEYYRNNGYMRAEVAIAEKVPVSDNRIDINFNISQGPQYKVRSVSFGPIKVYSADQLYPGLSLLGGDDYSSQKVADDITMIRKYYGAKGYADAAVRADLKEVPNSNEVDIQYIVVEGTPSKVGNIHIQGNSKTKDYVIRRELPLKPEDEFSSVEMETAQKRLKNLNYFEPVAVTPAPSSRPGYRDINIEVREKSTGSLTFGLGFSTIESVVLFANVTQANFDITDWDTFTGGGQRFSVDVRAGDETQNATISWVEPWFMGQKLAFGVDAFYARSTYYSDYYTQTNIGAAVSLRQPLTENSYLRYEYKLEQINVDANGYAPLYFLIQDGDYLRSAVSLSYVYDTRDSLIIPRKGGKFGATAGFSGLGGDIKTYTLGLDFCKFWNLKWDTIFSINGAVTTVESWKKDDTYIDPYGRDVPVFDRLYLGGPQNLRGFKYRNVAPYIEGTYGSGDETMGGKSSAFVQFEYTIPIVEEVRFAIFYDIGVVNEGSYDFNTSKYASDWGIGLRLNLPFGPIAVDYAWPVESGNAIDEGGQFQFYMNYKF